MENKIVWHTDTFLCDARWTQWDENWLFEVDIYFNKRSEHHWSNAHAVDEAIAKCKAEGFAKVPKSWYFLTEVS